MKVSMTASAKNCVDISFFFRADGLAQADLARALGDRRQHHVHDADAADDERDAGHRAEQDGECAGHARGRRDDVGLVQRAEVGQCRVGNIVAREEQAGDVILHLGHSDCWSRLQIEL